MSPLGVVENLRKAVDFGLGVRVQCVLGGSVLVGEVVLGGLEHDGRVAGERAVCLPGRGDCAVESVAHGVFEVAGGFVWEFMSRILLVLLGNALLPLDLPLLQVHPDVGYLRPALGYVVAGFCGVSVWRRVASCFFACQRSCSMSPRAVGGWSSSVWGVAVNCRRQRLCAWL